MRINGTVQQVVPIVPHGTNSTMFTDCCNVAIRNDQIKCPICKSLIVGYDAPNDHARGIARWRNATRFWSRQ